MNSAEQPFKYKRQLLYEFYLSELEKAGFTKSQARGLLAFWIEISGNIPLDIYGL